MYSYSWNNPIKYYDPNGQNVITKLIKQTYKRDGDIIEAVFDVGGDIITVFAPSSTPLDRLEAAVALVSPVDLDDIKSAKKWYKSLNKKFSGRKGGIDTRSQNQAIGDTIEKRGGSKNAGFGGKEKRFAGNGKGNKGSRYSDGSAKDKNGNSFEVQTVDTKADGSLTAREYDAAIDIAGKSGNPVVAIPKVKIE